MTVAADEPAQGAGSAFLYHGLGQSVRELLVHEQFFGVLKFREQVGQVDRAGGGGEGGHIAAARDGDVKFAVAALLHIGLLVTQ